MILRKDIGITVLTASLFMIFTPEVQAAELVLDCATSRHMAGSNSSTQEDLRFDIVGYTDTEREGSTVSYTSNEIVIKSNDGNNDINYTINRRTGSLKGYINNIPRNIWLFVDGKCSKGSSKGLF